MRVCDRDLYEQAALGAADVEHGLVVLEREPLCDPGGRACAQPGHRVQELAEPVRICVELAEEVAAGTSLVLGLAGTECVGQAGPERIQPGVRHLEQAANVGGLAAVEEEAGLGCVRVEAFLALQHPECDESIEEVHCASPVEPEAVRDLLLGEWLLRDGREEAELDGAQQCLRAPEREPELENDFGCGRRMPVLGGMDEHLRSVGHGSPFPRD